MTPSKKEFERLLQQQSLMDHIRDSFQYTTQNSLMLPSMRAGKTTATVQALQKMNQDRRMQDFASSVQTLPSSTTDTSKVLEEMNRIAKSFKNTKIHGRELTNIFIDEWTDMPRDQQKDEIEDEDEDFYRHNPDCGRF
jgi:hypothetical protein